VSKLSVHLDKDGDGHIDVNATESTSHFEASKETFEAHGNRPDDNEHKNRYKKNSSSSTHTGDFDINSYAITSNLTQDIKDALAYMGNEERLAYDVYTNLYNYHKDNNSLEIKQLTNIATKSEIKHIGIVKELVKRYTLGSSDLTNVDSGAADYNVTFENMPSGVYDISAIQDLYNTLYNMGQASQEMALKVGCMVEVTDINDLDNYILKAVNSNATDVLEAFKVLRDGSYNHYWSFDEGLKSLGVTNGCYYEGDNLLSDKSTIYPTNEHGSEEKGNGEGHGKGSGNGKQKGKH
jgi:hypothetical protein